MWQIRPSMRTTFRVACLLVAASLAAPQRAAAQDSMILLRDAEIESTLRTFMTPIWKVAGLDPQAIRIYIVNDPALNSFVAGGQNIFMNTGTIMRETSPNQIIGIMAHETGHIVHGDIARNAIAVHNAMIESIIGMVLGGAATVLGHGNGGAGGVLAGESVGERAYLQHSVVVEAAADQAALRFLDLTHQSARGLLQFFQILEQEMFLNAQHQDPYLQNHPLTEDRIAYVQKHVDQSPYSDNKDPPDWIAANNLMKAKLGAFLGNPSQVLAQWKPDDNSEPARYARAIAYYRIPDLKNAIPTIEGLIADHPDNPYYAELKGQMLFENGRVAEAVAPYERAVQLRPAEPLLNIELAQVQLETNDPKMVPKAVAELNAALRVESDNGDAWRFLAIAYGRTGDIGMAALALAEQNMADGDYKQAAIEADRAQKILPAGPQRQHAQDLRGDAQRHQQEIDNQ
jgi:predicted Zn-dependent protease